MSSMNFAIPVRDLRKERGPAGLRRWHEGPGQIDPGTGSGCTTRHSEKGRIWVSRAPEVPIWEGWAASEGSTVHVECMVSGRKRP
jgi:hypothetical protein